MACISTGNILHPRSNALQMGARKEDRRFSLPARRVQRRPTGEAALRDQRWLSVFARAVLPGRQVRAAFWGHLAKKLAEDRQYWSRSQYRAGQLEPSGSLGMRLLDLRRCCALSLHSFFRAPRRAILNASP